MHKFTIITVGKIKFTFWNSAVEHYRKRLEKICKINSIYLKDAPAALNEQDKKTHEGQRILAAIPNGSHVICLDEHGQNLTSRELAVQIEKVENCAKMPCFIVGGAYGLAAEVLQKADQTVCMGKLTYTHELAQAILWEQLFRIDSIHRKTGYHHD